MRFRQASAGASTRVGSSLPSTLANPPIEDHDLAEIAEHHVSAFQVTMHDVPGMGIAHGIAHAHENAQQRIADRAVRAQP